ncbi:hypothetical protein FH5_04722 [Priestia endophytica]|nr:hypothetical protein FH5_04722 [Priestia endophytica]
MKESHILRKIILLSNKSRLLATFCFLVRKEDVAKKQIMIG